MTSTAFLLLLVLAGTSAYTTSVNTWWDGFEIKVRMPICKNINAYTIRFSLNQNIDKLDADWLGTVQSGQTNNFQIKKTDEPLSGGTTKEFAIVGRTWGRQPDGIDLTSFSIDELSTCSGSGDSGKTASSGTAVKRGSSGPKNYASALQKSILFYDAQRSGKLPSNNPISWRGDSALSDSVTGGWYDAGDNVKFTFTIAYAATTQLWSLRRFNKGYVSASRRAGALSSVKWGLDFLLKSWRPGSSPPSSGRLVAQIGDGHVDHAYWGRPENMNMARPTTWLSSSKPGSNVAGETAAALALGYLVFKNDKPVYASKLLTAAKQVFAFAERYQGEYDTQGFYPSSGSKDELCVAAVWLKRATGQSTYLNKAKGFYTSAWNAWAYSWDDKKIACQLLLYEETKESQYKQKVVSFLDEWNGGGVPQTPCGLAWRDAWGSNRYAANAAFIALVAAKDGINPTRYVDFAKKQIDYMLGDNNKCFSYLIGFGDTYPKEPHHRGASCRAVSWNDCEKSGSNPYPNQLTGALVGGPGRYDDYVDSRQDYQKNEVAIDYNAGFQGALAGLLSLDTIPSTNNKCPCN
ncbi:hypothetical protein BaRGS_00027360 [Batillaria attramentaria]|uniref:Endoglucanase n=1 Tax=Batillaria attramentaria TaxID=370345 RepID=A0ABD0K2F0_9CAEN